MKYTSFLVNSGSSNSSKNPNFTLKRSPVVPRQDRRKVVNSLNVFLLAIGKSKDINRMNKLI